MTKYIYLISFILLCSCANKKPQLIFRHYTYDFGFIKKDSVYNGETIIKNIGNDTLNIQHISPDCSCTNAYSTKIQLLPEDTCLIKFSYRTYHKIGKQENFITVFANTDSIVHLLQINAFVR